jgi:Raf kinase inhibitor-like YbhB/YbcL family protein
MKTLSVATSTALAVALLLAGCAQTGAGTPNATAPEVPMPTTSSAAPQPSVDPTAFSVTSPDFADGEELADIHTADAFSGQCTGDNINPALEWTNAPEGTVTFAIAMTDESASGWVHWVHANIPADVTTVAQGESASLAGVAGRDQATGEAGYFGPCPPGPNHRYVFTVYALDAELALEPRFSGLDLTLAMSGHILAESAITGMRSGPA